MISETKPPKTVYTQRDVMVSYVLLCHGVFWLADASAEQSNNEKYLYAYMPTGMHNAEVTQTPKKHKTKLFWLLRSVRNQYSESNSFLSSN